MTMMDADDWRERWGLEGVSAYAGDTKQVRREYGQTALKRRFIQANPRAMVSAVVMDIDRPSAVMDALERPHDHPDPSWIIETAHGAHVGWWLADPVTRTAAAHEKPLRYLARVQEGLCRSLGADPAYSGFITRNPIYPGLIAGEVIWGTDHLYGLHEMRTPAMPRQLPRKLENTRADLGRNCSLFHSGRTTAYSLYKQMGWPGADPLYRAMISHLLDLNGGMAPEAGGPLPLNEVRSIARSIAKWTAQHITEEGFRAQQTARGTKGGKKSGEKRREKRNAARTQLSEVLK